MFQSLTHPIINCIMSLMKPASPYLANLFSGLPDQAEDEVSETIIDSVACKIERIVSMGHSTPAGKWYDQAQNEWVMVLKGSAGLRFMGEEKIIEMQPGDHIHIPAGCKHRVEWN